LVDVVATFHAFTPEERAEAITIALSDPDTALRCFRALVQEIEDLAKAPIEAASSNLCVLPVPPPRALNRQER
jgi:hypothetical protein